MFLQNRYTVVYFKIIDRARSEDRKKKQGTYYERHHILPRSAGGSNSKDNLVLLTAKEHLVCHFLLTRMFEGTFLQSKMKHALSCMANLNGYAQRRQISGNRRFYVAPLSAETKNLLSEQKRGSKNPQYGNSQASAHLRKYSEALKGKRRDPEVALKIKQNKLLKMCQLMYQHFDVITDETIKEAKDIGILAISYPSTVSKIEEGLGFLPTK